MLNRENLKIMSKSCNFFEFFPQGSENLPGFFQSDSVFVACGFRKVYWDSNERVIKVINSMLTKIYTYADFPMIL